VKQESGQGISADLSRQGSDELKADLDGIELWDQFHKHGTEMVITKSGRLVSSCIFIFVDLHCFGMIRCSFVVAAYRPLFVKCAFFWAN